ncbi:MAG: MotA/TolQ/ExbB proton channel family protein [Candidatus Azobacteroides sp.]|nr:MotA/TolQ/ExbB proton channel family protein [Candidatus Azobacteroides sp.]
MNIFELAIKGGWVMIPIVLLFFIAVGVFVERILVINQAAKEDDYFMERIKDYIHDGNIKSAEKLCQTTNTPYARMIEKGIQRLGRPMNDILTAIENVGNIEVAKLEKGFPWVATTAALAPMLGFFGTVTGMVRAFFDMANAGSNVDITLLSSGIYEALVTTVAGLAVGIPILFAYNYLVAKVDGVVAQMETSTMDFMDLLNEPTK